MGRPNSGGLDSPYTNISPGTIFKITPGGELTTLYDFCSTGGSNGAGFCADGQNPYEIGSLLSDGQGDFYGTTFFGGSGSAGIVFEITSAGAYSVLVSNTGCVTFCSPGASAIAGAFPSPVIQGSDGNLYGTTYEEGAFNYGGGSIFEIASGVASTLYTFPCAVVVPCDTVGAYPSGVLPSYGGLLQATDGNFYGLAQNGGTYNATCPAGCGTVFKFSTGLGPFVKTRTSSGFVGAAVTLLGNDLTGTTSVTFNGTAASFVVKSATEITATVPTGATTGAVQVVTPERHSEQQCPLHGSFENCDADVQARSGNLCGSTSGDDQRCQRRVNHLLHNGWHDADPVLDGLCRSDSDQRKLDAEGYRSGIR